MVKNDTDARLTTHEEVCALRYEQINARLKRLEQHHLCRIKAYSTFKNKEQ